MLSAISTAVACGITFSPDLRQLQQQYAECRSNPEKWHVLQTEATKYLCLAPKDGFEPYRWDITPTELNLFSLHQYTLYTQKKEKSGINHKNWVLDQDPLIYYLRFKAPPISNFSDHQARIILHYFTNKTKFIHTHFVKNASLSPLFASKFNGKTCIDPLLIWCARYNHLFIIEWLLNIQSMRAVNHYNIDFAQMEMINNQSLLHVLSLYSRIPRYKKLIFRLLSEVNIDVWYLMGRRMPSTVMPSTLSDFYNGFVNMLKTQQFGEGKDAIKLLSFTKAIDIFAGVKNVPFGMLRQAIRNNNVKMSIKIIEECSDLNIYARDSLGNTILRISIVCVPEYGHAVVLNPFLDPFGMRSSASINQKWSVKKREGMKENRWFRENNNRINIMT